MITPAAYLRGEKREIQLELDIPPEFILPIDHIKSLSVSFKKISPSGFTYSTSSSVDHPSFDKLRRLLEKQGYISIWEGVWNGDRVLKPFYFNGILLSEGDNFYCSSAWSLQVKDRTECKQSTSTSTESWQTSIDIMNNYSDPNQLIMTL